VLLKAIVCQALSREFAEVAHRSAHSIQLEILTMGLHEKGAGMRDELQRSIDKSDGCGYDAILLGYALCGGGTAGLRAAKTKIVIPRAHDCIGILMGSRQRYEQYFADQPGRYFRSPGWVEFQQSGQDLQPAGDAVRRAFDKCSREDLITRFGVENGNYLYEQFNAFRRNYSGLTYISTGVSGEATLCKLARAEAEQEGWEFEEIEGSVSLLERLVNGYWDSRDFLVVPPGARIRMASGDAVVEAVGAPDSCASS
jgi:hypothetical protein